MNKISNILIELKNYSLSTYEHSIRVANICMILGRELGLTDEEVRTLKIAGLLHDIGKLKIPKEILQKPSKLTKEEYEIIKKHPEYGAEVLISSGIKNTEIIDLVLMHHERIDGLGYPKGIKDESIPKLAKIITICDCFDAMNSKRSYKEAQGINYIKSEFINNSGTQFDSYYAKELLAWLDEKVLDEESKKKK